MTTTQTAGSTMALDILALTPPTGDGFRRQLVDLTTTGDKILAIIASSAATRRR